MPYTEPKSSDTWFNLPSVVAAYQPISAPDPISARQNVSSNFARLGQYTAIPGVAPTFSPATGWIFAGTQYLTTNILPTASWSALIRLSNVTNADTWSFGNYASSGWGIQPRNANQTIYYNGSFFTVPIIRLNGVWGLIGSRGYYNGISETTALSGASPNLAIFLGDISGIYRRYFVGNMLAFAIYSRTLSAVEVWQASYQMRYADQNPDWSAWGRRRKWFIVSAGTAFQAAWAARTNNLIGGGVDV